MEIKFNIGDKIWYGCPAKQGILAQIRIFKNSTLYYVYGNKRGYKNVGLTKEEASIRELENKIAEMQAEIKRISSSAESKGRKMSVLLDLVPSLDMCLKIPNGEFSDSAFLWIEADDKNVSGHLICRTKTLKNFGIRTIPAPTLQEIMEEISSIDKIYSECQLTGKTLCKNPKYDPSIHYSPEKHFPWSAKRWRDSIWVEQAETACEAALRTYLSIKDITVTMRCPDCGFWLKKVDNNYCEIKTKNNIEEQFIVLSEICPNCRLEFFDTFSCFIDKLSNFTKIITPMGIRWIRKRESEGKNE